MAEENTDQSSEDTEEPLVSDSGGESTEEAVTAEVNAEDAAAGDALEDEGQTSDSVDTSSYPSGKETPKSANEPNIVNEVPSSEHTRATNVDGGEITTPITDISMLLDIPVTLSMEIGQTKISINELLKLGKDSVIELQRMAHEPLDVLVNGTLVAHGEAVVVGDRFGIRLTDVISTQERLRKFG